MTQQEAIILATRALFAFATNVRRPPTWIGTPEDIDEALGLLLPALMAPGSAGLRTEITGCASAPAGPEPGDPRQQKLPGTEAATPPRAVCPRCRVPLEPEYTCICDRPFQCIRCGDAGRALDGDGRCLDCAHKVLAESVDADLARILPLNGKRKRKGRAPSTRE